MLAPLAVRDVFVNQSALFLSIKQQILSQKQALLIELGKKFGQSMGTQNAQLHFFEFFWYIKPKIISKKVCSVGCQICF
jgi:hypothetical protein